MIKIAVIKGGPKAGYKRSMLSGNLMFSTLTDPKNQFSKNYEVINIIIDQNNNWYLNKVIINPSKLKKLIDIAIVCINEKLASSFKVKERLKRNSIKYIGSDPSQTKMAYDKNTASKILTKNKIKTPKLVYIKNVGRKNYKKFNKYIFDKSNLVINNLSMPCIGKPVSSNMSNGVRILNSKDEIISFIKKSFSDRLLTGIVFEEFIKGREVRMTLIERFRNKKFFVLPPLEMILPDGRFFDSKLKNAGNNKVSCPANFSPQEVRKLTIATIKVHKIFKLRHYSRVEFIVHKNRGVFAFDIVNTIPKMSENHKDSLLSINLSSINSNIKEFMNHLINLEVKR